MSIEQDGARRVARVTDSRGAMVTRVIADLSINKDERGGSHQRHEVSPWRI